MSLHEEATQKCPKSDPVMEKKGGTPTGMRSLSEAEEEVILNAARGPRRINSDTT